MVSDPERGGLMDEEQVARLLNDAFTAPPLRESFVEALSRQLDAEYLRSDGAFVRGKTPSEDGARGSAPRAAKLQRRRRALTMVGIAASILVALAIWGNRPSYSWAKMIEALETTPWVQTTAATDEDHGGWISWVHRVVATQSEGKIVFDDLAGGMRSEYRENDQVIYRRPLAGTSSIELEQRLLRLILDGEEGPPVEVMQESWRQVRDATGRWIELRVTIAPGGGGRGVLEVSFRLDPATHLPQSCRILGANQDVRSEQQFTYPAEGPRDVYGLNVPQNASVVQPGSSRPVEKKTAPHEERPPVNNAADHTPIQSEKLPVLNASEMSKRIGELLAQLWQQNGIEAAEPASDAVFLRRLYLDLTGRIPSVSEIREFSDDVQPNRRERIVDSSLECRDHATHLAAAWRQFLLPDGVDLGPYGGTAGLEQWLAHRFQRNVPYDQMVRELLLAEGRVTESGPVLFYSALKLNPEEIASQTSRAFLGMRLECAQCHDHPFDSRWSQEDFWGYAAFFARISRPNGKLEMISSVMRVLDTRRGDVMLPDTGRIVAPCFPQGEMLVEQTDSPSRRQRLADWLTATDNEHFSRATVNRVWAHLFGQGLIEPVDDMRSDNPAVCPELLDELAHDFIHSGFDLRRLFRTLVLTGAYQLSSRSAAHDPARTEYFAQMNIKGLTAEQLYDCIVMATLSEPLQNVDSSDASLARFENVRRRAFLEEFHAPPGQTTAYHGGIPQALTLMNGQLVDIATDPSAEGLLQSLSAPFFSEEQQLDTLFQATLSRQPSESERALMLEYISTASAEQGREEALGNILWALLNSAEFTFNH